MEPQHRIFRKSALDKLSSPEQLDQLMQVTTPKSWIALLACGALVLTALLWGVFGTIPTKVYGRGILIKQGGVFVATSRGDGNVMEILVKTGALVSSNQVLVKLSQPELKLRIEQNEESLARLRLEYDQLKRYQEQETEHERTSFAKQRSAYEGIAADYDKQILWLNQRLEAQKELEKKELLTQAQVLDSRIKLFSVQHEMEQANIQLRQIDINEMQARERRRQQLLDKDNQIKQTQNQLDYLLSLHELNTQILSPFQGNVLEIMVKEGQLLSPNSPILSLQADHKSLEARLFLSPTDGKLAASGMPVAISPVSAKKEEFGFMLGKVNSVSEFPTTPQGMLRILENQSLVSEFSLGGAPIEVTVTLELNPRTVSGFRWSSDKGPPLRISSGTMCTGTITITNQRPISLVLPLIKKSVGM